MIVDTHAPSELWSVSHCHPERRQAPSGQWANIKSGKLMHLTANFSFLEVAGQYSQVFTALQ